MKWVELVAAGLAAGACLVIAPLDDAKTESSSSTPDAAGGNAGVGGSTSDSGGECTENQDCIDDNAEEAYRCLPIEKRCVKLKSEDCPVALGSYKDPNALFIAAFSAVNQNEPGNEATTKNYLLALNEFNSGTVAGLEGRGGVKRPLALVVCKNGSGLLPDARREVVLRATQHVVETLRVPGVIAAVESGDLIFAFNQYGKKNNVFFLTPFGATQVLATHDDDDLLWHILGSPADLAPSYAAALAAYEKFYKPGGQMFSLRVALVYTDQEPFEMELKAAADAVMVANGMLLKDNGPNYLEVPLPSAAGDMELGAAASKILTFKPHVIVSMTGENFARLGSPNNPNDPPGVLTRVEGLWAISTNGAPRPRYLLSPLNAEQIESDLIPYIEAVLYGSVRDVTAHERFIGINVAGSEDATLYNDYEKRLHLLEPLAPKGDENFYDAFYFLAYGIQAAGALEQVYGSDIAFNFERLMTTGEKVDVGPTEILRGIDLLTEGSDPRIRLHGTLGPPNFRRETGTRIDTGAIYCIEKVSSTNLTLNYQVGYHDREVDPPVLRISRRYSGSPLPCLQQFSLPLPP